MVLFENSISFEKEICHSKLCGPSHHSQECKPDLGPKARCDNQNICHRTFSATKVALTTHVGFILQVYEIIKQRMLAHCYWDKLIDHDDSKQWSPIALSYSMHIKTGRTEKLVFIDAYGQGDVARFMSHSCEPSC